MPMTHVLTIAVGAALVGAAAAGSPARVFERGGVRAAGSPARVFERDGVRAAGSSARVFERDGVRATEAAARRQQAARSRVFEWSILEAKATSTGARRDVIRMPTPTLDELEIHVTTLNPGEVSHPPHRHPEEEVLIIKEGTVETLQNGVSSRLGPGSIIFQASNEPHNIRNAGNTPATYHVIQWRARR